MAGTEDSIWIGDLAFCSRKVMEQSPTRFQRYSLLFKFPGPSSPGSNLFCASRLSGEAPSNPTGSWAKFCYAYGVNEMLHTCYLLFSLCHLSFVICHLSC